MSNNFYVHYLFCIFISGKQKQTEVYLERKPNTAKIKVHRGYNDIFSVLTKVVNLYSALQVKREYWLADRERDFVVTTLIVYYNNCGLPTSDEAIQIYKKYFQKSITKQQILDRINKLSKKQWFIYEKEPVKKLVIPPFFSQLNFDLERDVVDFEVRLDYEESTINRRDLGENDPIHHDPGR